MLGFQILDILILLILVAGIARGFSTGLVRQVAGFIGFLLAFIISVRLMHFIGPMIVDSLGISPSLGPLIGFLTVFLIIQIIVLIIIRMIEGVIGALKLTGVNRFLGGIVGAFKAVLVLSVAFLILHQFDIPTEDTREESSLYAPVSSVLPEAWDFVTRSFPEVKRLSETFGDRLEEELNGAGR